MSQKSHKTDVRIYITDEHKAYLKTIADSKGTSVNRLILELIEKKYPLTKKAKVMHKAEKSPKPEIPPSACESAPSDTAEQDRKQKEHRLAEINSTLKKAYNGDTLPNGEYHRLKQEQAELRAELGHN